MTLWYAIKGVGKFLNKLETLCYTIIGRGGFLTSKRPFAMITGWSSDLNEQRVLTSSRLTILDVGGGDNENGTGILMDHWMAVMICLNISLYLEGKNREDHQWVPLLRCFMRFNADCWCDILIWSECDPKFVDGQWKEWQYGTLNRMICDFAVRLLLLPVPSQS